jgi:hypothetical protein
MSRKVNCWDNSVVESFFARLKYELEILVGLIRDPEQLLCDLWEWIEGSYNTIRRYSAIGYFTPIAFEEPHVQRAIVMLVEVRDLTIELGQPHYLALGLCLAALL